jgi:hypothetical protein
VIGAALTMSRRGGSIVPGDDRSPKGDLP